MDILTKLVSEHKGVGERMSFFKQSISVIDAGKTPNYVRDLSKFFQEYILAHFEFEESEIFSVVLTIGALEEKHIIRILQQEHISVLDKLDKFRDAILRSGFHLDANQLNELVFLAREIIDMQVNHAHKEDEELYPILKKLRFDFTQCK